MLGAEDPNGSLTKGKLVSKSTAKRHGLLSFERSEAQESFANLKKLHSSPSLFPTFKTHPKFIPFSCNTFQSMSIYIVEDFILSISIPLSNSFDNN